MSVNREQTDESYNNALWGMPLKKRKDPRFHASLTTSPGENIQDTDCIKKKEDSSLSPYNENTMLESPLKKRMCEPLSSHDDGVKDVDNDVGDNSNNASYVNSNQDLEINNYAAHQSEINYSCVTIPKVNMEKNKIFPPQTFPERPCKNLKIRVHVSDSTSESDAFSSPLCLKKTKSDLNIQEHSTVSPEKSSSVKVASDEDIPSTLYPSMGSPDFIDNTYSALNSHYDGLCSTEIQNRTVGLDPSMWLQGKEFNSDSCLKNNSSSSKFKMGLISATEGQRRETQQNSNFNAPTLFSENKTDSVSSFKKIPDGDFHESKSYSSLLGKFCENEMSYKNIYPKDNKYTYDVLMSVKPPKNAQNMNACGYLKDGKISVADYSLGKKVDHHKVFLSRKDALRSIQNPKSCTSKLDLTSIGRVPNSDVESCSKSDSPFSCDRSQEDSRKPICGNKSLLQMQWEKGGIGIGNNRKDHGAVPKRKYSYKGNSNPKHTSKIEQEKFKEVQDKRNILDTINSYINLGKRKRRYVSEEEKNCFMVSDGEDGVECEVISDESDDTDGDIEIVHCLSKPVARKKYFAKPKPFNYMGQCGRNNNFECSNQNYFGYTNKDDVLEFPNSAVVSNRPSYSKCTNISVGEQMNNLVPTLKPAHALASHPSTSGASDPMNGSQYHVRPLSCFGTLSPSPQLPLVSRAFTGCNTSPVNNITTSDISSPNIFKISSRLKCPPPGTFGFSHGRTNPLEDYIQYSSSSDVFFPVNTSSCSNDSYSPMYMESNYDAMDLPMPNENRNGNDNTEHPYTNLGLAGQTSVINYTNCPPSRPTPIHFSSSEVSGMSQITSQKLECENIFKKNEILTCSRAASEFKDSSEEKNLHTMNEIKTDTTNEETCNSRPEWECAICLETISSKRGISATLCGHVYCTVCITEVVNKKKECPTCRKALDATQVHPLFLFG